MTEHSTSTLTPANRCGHRPPGLVAPVSAWIVFWGSMVGLALDAVLAVSVIEEAFDRDWVESIAIVTVIGVIAAKSTTSAALTWNSGHRAVAGLALIAPALMGVMLAWARSEYGLGIEDDPAIPSASAGEQSQATNHLPGTALMLTLYVTSMVGVFLSALKLFHPARRQLKHHDKKIRKILAELAPMEADLVAIHERLATGDKRLNELEQSHRSAKEQLASREAALKAYARDAIARAVRDPAATPLVRAKHEPETPAGQLDDLYRMA